MRNNKGPKMEPCGTPYLRVWISDLSFIIDGYTLSSVAEIAFETIKGYSSYAVMVISLERRISWTVSKALCRSMKTPQAKLPLSRAFLIISVRRIRA